MRPLSAAVLLLLSNAAFAGVDVQVSEPGILELVGLGVAVAIAVKLRKRK